MTQKEYADSLRLIADFYEAHPTMPLPEGRIGVFSTTTREEFADAVAQMGTCEKEYGDNLVTASRRFGHVTLAVTEYKGIVCTRRVVGTRHVERQVIPATEAQVIEAHDEDVVEWDCSGPLLGPDPAEMEAEQ